MSNFWKSTLEVGYYDKVLIDGEKKRRGIKANWHKTTLHKCQQYIETTDVHLDYACGPGTLIGRFSNAESIGVDLAELQIDYARNKYSKKGTFLTTKEFDFDEYKNTFDIVTLIGLIEFLTNSEIEVLINNIHSSLKPGGTLIITTPNFNSLIYKIANKFNLINSSEQHINKFNIEKIKKIFTDSSLKLIKQRKVLSYGILFSAINLKLGSFFNKIFEKALLHYQGFLIIVELKKETSS